MGFFSMYLVEKESTAEIDFASLIIESFFSTQKSHLLWGDHKGNYYELRGSIMATFDPQVVANQFIITLFIQENAFISLE